MSTETPHTCAISFSLRFEWVAHRRSARDVYQRMESAQVLVMERKAVALHYLHTWFVLDLIASTPLDLLLRGRRLDILRLPRLLKIIRMMQNKSFSQAGEYHGTISGQGSPPNHSVGLHALETPRTLFKDQGPWTKHQRGVKA